MQPVDGYWSQSFLESICSQKNTFFCYHVNISGKMKKATLTINFLANKRVQYFIPKGCSEAANGTSLDLTWLPDNKSAIFSYLSYLLLHREIF